MLKKEEQKKRLGLKDKLKNVVDNISVDIFGYEKKVTKNIVQYLNKAAREERVPPQQLFARIVKRDATVRVFLHHRGMQLKEVPVKELAIFFAGKGTTDLFNIESKVAQSVGKYIDELSKLHEVRNDDLQIRISMSNSNVIVGAYNHLDFIKDIPVQDLVKYFKP
ncbi:MAG: hypothetical protein JKY51_06895 [Opitutaceae bacterium]|nr:hypothetical protein [Opitutaceae bacterium]